MNYTNVPNSLVRANSAMRCRWWRSAISRSDPTRWVPALCWTSSRLPVWHSLVCRREAAMALTVALLVVRPCPPASRNVCIIYHMGTRQLAIGRATLRIDPQLQYGEIPHQQKKAMDAALPSRSAFRRDHEGRSPPNAYFGEKFLPPTAIGACVIFAVRPSSAF